MVHLRMRDLHGIRVAGMRADQPDPGRTNVLAFLEALVRRMNSWVLLDKQPRAYGKWLSWTTNWL
jgi:hypothetical protein